MFIEKICGMIRIHDMADLKYWVLMKALWDPSRSAASLIDDFCRHYYGPAAPYLAEYVRRLEEAYRQEPIKIPFALGNRALQNFLSDAFLLESQRLFARAEQAVTADAILGQRVRRARLSLDLATLFYWNRMEATYRQSQGSLAGFPLNRERIAQRYQQTRLNSFAQRFPSLDLEAQSAEVDKILTLAERAPTAW